MAFVAKISTKCTNLYFWQTPIQHINHSYFRPKFFILVELMKPMNLVGQKANNCSQYKPPVYLLPKFPYKYFGEAMDCESLHVSAGNGGRVNLGDSHGIVVMLWMN